MHRTLLAQLQATDDYILFKGMMVKRNQAMNEQALMQIYKKGGKRAEKSNIGVPGREQADGGDAEEAEAEEAEYGDEEDEIQRAIEESKR